MKIILKPEAAVVDATVILNLARGGRLNKLCKLIRTIYVPKCVRRETKLNGRRRRRPDVELFKRRTTPCNEWQQDVFVAALTFFRQQDSKKSHRGEAEMIAQAERRGVRLVLTDDQPATRFAQQRGLEVWGTPLLLVKIAARQ